MQVITHSLTGGGGVIVDIVPLVSELQAPNALTTVLDLYFWVFVYRWSEAVWVQLTTTDHSVFVVAAAHTR
jgi:hypothetical protein